MKDDIIRMAREAGFNPVNYMGSNLELFIRFAALARADEREAIAKMFDGKVWAYDYREIADAIRARGQDPMPLFDDWPGGWK